MYEYMMGMGWSEPSGFWNPLAHCRCSMFGQMAPGIPETNTRAICFTNTPGDQELANQSGCIRMVGATSDTYRTCTTADGAAREDSGNGQCWCCPEGLPRSEGTSTQGQQIHQETITDPIPPDVEDPEVPVPVQEEDKDPVEPDRGTGTSFGFNKVITNPGVWVAVLSVTAAAVLGYRYWRERQDEEPMLEEAYDVL